MFSLQSTPTSRRNRYPRKRVGLKGQICGLGFGAEGALLRLVHDRIGCGPSAIRSWVRASIGGNARVHRKIAPVGELCGRALAAVLIYGLAGRVVGADDGPGRAGEMNILPKTIGKLGRRLQGLKPSLVRAVDQALDDRIMRVEPGCLR
jgi:hypothetical protein